MPPKGGMKNDGVRVYPGSRTRVSLSKDAYMPVCLKKAVTGLQRAIMSSVSKNGQHPWAEIDNRDSILFF